MQVPQHAAPVYNALKAVSYVTLAAIALAMVYTVWISIRYWSGIGV